MAYWYCYRQTTPRPPGARVVCGPFESRELAMSARERDKLDGELGVPFEADTKAEAEAKAAFQ